MNAQAAPTRDEAAAVPEGGPYAWYAVSVLILAYAFSFIDRQALTLMVDPIRKSLDITDTQLSLLHGFAFALFYTVMGIPIGRMVDQRRRTWIIAAGIVIWSLMTAACGLARNFIHMFLARIGVGVGEAALSPGAYSLISDYFPPHQRTQALSLYLSAAYVGAGLATMIGGALIAAMPAITLPHLGELEPWQGVFIAVGLPGILVALLVLALREPPRTGVKAGVPPHFREVLRYMAGRKKSYFLLIIGFSLSGLMWNGSVAWLPTYFMRTFGWTTSQVGMNYGLTMMIAGILGAVTGGWTAALMQRRGRQDANIVIGLVSLAIATPGGVFGALAGSGSLALAGIFVFLFGCAMPYGGAAAALQAITPNQMRGQVSAIYLFSLSFIGMGIGPTVVAFFTDHVFGNDAAIGQSLAATMLLSAPLAAVVLWLARRPYRETLARVDF
jgi:MFS family permease